MFEEIKEEFKEKIATLILGGLTLVAALSWNEAIKSLIETIFPKKSSELIGKFIYAIIITIFIVIVSVYLKKLIKKNNSS